MEQSDIKPKTESLCKPKAESLLYAEAPPNFMEQSDIKPKTQNPKLKTEN